MGVSAATLKGMAVRNYIAIAEPSDDGTWWISFPGLPGVTSAASGAQQIAPQAQDALTSAVEAGAVLPPAIEDGAIPPHDLGDYHKPLVVLVSYAVPAIVQ
jgi:predicted RNase H-like HicB family nuclease